MAPLDDFVLTQAVGFHVNRVAHLMSEEIARRFARAGYPVSAQDFGILYHLRKRGPMTHGEVARIMRRDKTTITRRLDGLARKGLIERRRHPNDRRASLVTLTGSGARAVATTAPMVRDFQREVLRDVPPRDQAATIRTLRHIATVLDDASISSVRDPEA